MQYFMNHLPKGWDCVVDSCISSIATALIILFVRFTELSVGSGELDHSFTLVITLRNLEGQGEEGLLQ